MRRRFIAAVIGLALCGTAGVHASTFDPLYRFRTLRTPHFSIYFHQGEETMAVRLAGIAEDTWRALQPSLGPSLPSHTHVILVDQTERYNGSATPIPRSTIVIYSAWPRGSDFLKVDDWLRVVFAHEFTHIVHLDRSRGYAALVKHLFGRTPFAFPNLFLPTWQVEGIATYEESAVTGTGRLHAGDFRAIVDEAARGGRLESLDRVNGGLVTWPAGQAPYAYGLGFHAFLANRYGARSFAALADRTSGRLPFFGSPAFKATYGRSLGDLWHDYESSVATAASASTGPTVPAAAEQLTHHGSIVIGPRFDRPSCATCAADILYSIAGPDDFPAMYRLPAGGTPRQVTWRYAGSTTAPGTEALFFDQLEVARESGVYSDLYRVDRASGRVTRLTHGARLLDPDLSPDGRTLAAVREHTGQRDLVTIAVTPGVEGDPALESPDVLLAEADTQFNAPRWSPDGRSLAVERHRLGRQPEIVVFDVSTRAVRVVASDPVARWVTPAWRPDGRAIVAAADFDEGPFNLFEIDLSTLEARAITATTGGATWPDISADGTTIIYVGYTPNGFDVFRIPYRTLGGAAGDPRRTSAANPDTLPASRSAQTPPQETRAYSPWPSVLPTSWYPIVTTDNSHTRIGAGTSGEDLLAYHAYAVSASWNVQRPESAVAASSDAPDWRAAYAYTRWRPVIHATASTETSFLSGPPSDDGRPSTATRRERLFEMGLAVPVTHVRAQSLVRTSFVRAENAFTFDSGSVTSDRSAIRAAASISTAHFYGHSVSLEDGIMAGATAEFVRPAFGASGEATTITGDVRAYLPGFWSHHVLAIRAGAGQSKGSRTLGRAFLLGGGESNPDPATFSSDGFSLLRGFPEGSFAGTSVSVINVDYRWPIVRIERGLGTLPIFLQTIHASVFGDAGHAWTRHFAVGSIKRAVGAELSADVVFGYSLPLTITAGGAYGSDGSGLVRRGISYHFRVGRAF